MDVYSKEQRSKLMSSVKSKNTKPELEVRRIVHRLGFRYRLHQPLPGRPDLVFARLRSVIFVHGCFWHRHLGCAGATMPATNVKFWRSKFQANEARDRRVIATLAEQGWKVITVWECELKDRETLSRRLQLELTDGS